MTLNELLTTARDSITVRRVFADPYEKDGVTIIAAASVAGGGGGGSGQEEGGGGGEGGGFGVAARPAGVYVVKDGNARWRPAFDVNRLIIAASTVAVVYLVTRMRIARILASARD